jgi:hypothetical protein
VQLILQHVESNSQTATDNFYYLWNEQNFCGFATFYISFAKSFLRMPSNEMELDKKIGENFR